MNVLFLFRLITSHCFVLYAGPCTTASCPQLCVGNAGNTAAVCLCDERYTLPPDNNAFLCDAFASKLYIIYILILNLKNKLIGLCL
jgi:hypothetical protein